MRTAIFVLGILTLLTFGGLKDGASRTYGVMETMFVIASLLCIAQDTRELLNQGGHK